MIAGVLVDVSRNYALSEGVRQHLNLRGHRRSRRCSPYSAAMSAEEMRARRLEELTLPGQTYMLRSLSNLKSLRENVPVIASAESRTGM